MSVNENNNSEILSISAANDTPEDHKVETQPDIEVQAEVVETRPETPKETSADVSAQDATSLEKPAVKTASKPKATKKAPAKAVKKPARKAKPVSKAKSPKPKTSAPKKKAQTTSKKTTAAPAKKPAQRSISISYLHPTTPKEMEKLMTNNKAQMDKFAQDASELGKENMEAFVKCGTLFAKGFEELLRASVTFAQDTAEKQAQYVQEAMSSKTLNELTEVNNKMAQANFDDFMAGASKISELGVKVLTDSTQPLNEQVNKTIQKATESMAA